MSTSYDDVDQPVNIQHDRYRIQQNKTTPTTIQGVLQYESYSQCNFSRDNFGSKRLYEHIRIFQNKPFSRCMQTDFFSICPVYGSRKLAETYRS